MMWLSGSVKFRCVLALGLPSARWASPRWGMASAGCGSNQSGSRPASWAFSIARSLAASAFFRERSALSRSFCCSLASACSAPRAHRQPQLLPLLPAWRDHGQRQPPLPPPSLCGPGKSSPSGPGGAAAPWGDHCPAFPCRTCCPPAHPGSRPSASAP